MRLAPIVEGLALLGFTFAVAYGLGISTLWLVVPVLWLTWRGRRIEDYGLQRGRPCGAAFHAVMVLGVFVPYMIGHYLFAHLLWGATFVPRLPDDMAWAVVEHVLLIALPEEVFFRGYLQTQLDKASPRRWRVMGAGFGVGLPLAALLFGACHILNGGPGRLITAFPGIWYGWLRARTDSIRVPTIYHAASNLLMKFMVASLVP
jgi:membrane protease YdiL (CAAX protease family)